MKSLKKEVKRKISRPEASSESALRRMQAAKTKNTAPEIALRSLIYHQGFHYRIDARPLKEFNRRADIVFRSAKVAIFVDGCFWHGCPIHATQAKSNAEFWSFKIKQNRERDVDTTKHLEKAGWKVIRVWEHENPVKASEKICGIIKKRQIVKKQKFPMLL